MKLLIVRRNRIYVSMMLCIMLLICLGQTATAGSIQDSNAVSVNDTLLQAYEDFNNEKYVYIEYTKNNEVCYEIEIDHKNKIKRISRIESDPFKAAQKDEGEKKEAYIDYEKGIKYYIYSDEGPKQSKLKLNGIDKNASTFDTDNLSTQYDDEDNEKDLTSEWINDITGLNLLWKEEIGEIESIYDEKVEYIGIKDLSGVYREADDEDTPGKTMVIGLNADNTVYRYRIDSSGAMSSVLIKTNDEEITLRFKYDDNKTVTIPESYRDMIGDVTEASEEDIDEAVITSEEKDELTTESTRETENSKKPVNNSILFLIIVLTVIVIIVIIIVIIKKKRVNRAVLEKEQKNIQSVEKINRDKTTNAVDEKAPVPNIQKPSMREMYKLKFTVTDKDKKKKELFYELKRGHNVIVGRSDMSSVVIEDPMLSRQHFMISFDEDTLYIEDLDTTNGTMINGNKITSRTKLTQRAVVSAGNYDIRIDW